MEFLRFPRYELTRTANIGAHVIFTHKDHSILGVIKISFSTDRRVAREKGTRNKESQSGRGVDPLLNNIFFNAIFIVDSRAFFDRVRVGDVGARALSRTILYIPSLFSISGPG